jgi:hypothetical protein
MSIAVYIIAINDSMRFNYVSTKQLYHLYHNIFIIRYTNQYSFMKKYESYFNIIYKEIIANSLFTERQIDIIYNRLSHQTVPENISRGAYHRQLKQCRNKIIGVLYSILLLKSIGAIDQQTLFLLGTMCDQLVVMLDNVNSDISHNKITYNVTSTVNSILKKMCKV